ncbi:hypothetical protein TWF730_010938 [Orbilia blumenaviensis]|uniref:Uncharacterized protein n=1 Tax=Orbilia blumenaviensis TaxID=1796055 RepID=A0AAV9UJ86_9PEZI
MARTTKQDVHNYGASPSTPLLPPPEQEETPELTSHHRFRIRKLLLVLLCVSLLTPLYQIAKFCFPDWPFPSNPRPPSIPWRFYSRQYEYGLTPKTTSDSYTLSIHESINSNHFPLGITGSVKLLTGKPTQSHSLLVYVQVMSTFSSPVNCIKPNHIIVEGSAENITITSIPNEHPVNRDPSEFHDPQTFVNIYIYTRPQPVRLGHVSISTDLLPITIPQSGAHFQTTRLSLSSTHNPISNLADYGKADLMYASEMYLYSRHSHITGFWYYGLSYSAIAPEDDVRITLYPQKISWGPYTPADITISGNRTVAVNMPFYDSALSLRNSSISITSSGGDVFARVVAGSSTQLKAPAGSIIACLLPYWGYMSDGNLGVFTPKFETHSYFNTKLEVYTPAVNGIGAENPLELTNAKHVADLGWVRATYPAGFWKGRIDVESTSGRPEILGVDGKEIPGVVREGVGRAYLEGQNLVSSVSVVAGKEAIFEVQEAGTYAP